MAAAGQTFDEVIRSTNPLMSQLLVKIKSAYDEYLGGVAANSIGEE